jgi:hypothetical protein
MKCVMPLTVHRFSVFHSAIWTMLLAALREKVGDVNAGGRIDDGRKLMLWGNLRGMMEMENGKVRM